VKTEEWTGTARRVAGVNALGLGGTNVHVIVAQPAEREPSPPDQGSRTWRLALSAHTPDALRAVAERLGAHLAEHPELRLDDVEHTLAVGRRRLASRMIVACTSREDAIRALSSSAVSSQDQPWPEGTSGQIVRLPAYPFQRRRHWIEPPSAENRVLP
jgi:acyl transferase domain-containing protein